MTARLHSGSSEILWCVSCTTLD